MQKGQLRALISDAEVIASGPQKRTCLHSASCRLRAFEADIAGQNQRKMGGEAACRGQSVRAKTPGVTPTCRVNATLNALAEA